MGRSSCAVRTRHSARRSSRTEAKGSRDAGGVSRTWSATEARRDGPHPVAERHVLGRQLLPPVCSVSRRSSIQKSVPGEPRGVSWQLEIKHTVKQPGCERGRLEGEGYTAKRW